MKRCIRSGQWPGMTASIPCFSARARISSLLWPLSAKSLSAANLSIGAIVRAQSAVAPRVTKALTGMPCASAARCDFVLSPPCVAHVPIASSRGRRLWVNPASIISHNDRRKVRLVNRNFRRSLPHAIIAPAGEASAGIASAAKVRGRVSPRSARAHNPEDSIDKAPVVASPAAPASFTAG